MDDEQVREVVQEILQKRDKRRRTLWHHIRTGLYAIVRAIEREFDWEAPSKNK